MVLKVFAKLLQASVLIQSTLLSHAFTVSPQLPSISSKLQTKRPIESNSNLFSESPTTGGNGGWNGEVVSNTEDGRIRGCSITKVDGTITDWVIQIDGVEADLGKFSEAIYRKICSDAKQQRFQGFRPNTIPPHLLPTYIGFSMDECAREATLEALSQNDIKPFDDTRMEMTFDTFSILPPQKKSKKKKGGRKKNQSTSSEDESIVKEEETKWLTFETMKEAIDGGWKVRTLYKYYIFINCIM